MGDILADIVISEDNTTVDTEIVDTGEHISEKLSKMTSVDLGLFGLDCFVGDKTSSMEQDLDMYTSSEFESLLAESSGQNILDMSLQSSGITQTAQDNSQVRGGAALQWTDYPKNILALGTLTENILLQ